MTVDELLQTALNGDQRALARLATILERGGPASTIVSRAINGLPREAHVLGLTGPPGSGKSSLLSSLASEIARQNRRVAILAVDPSSPVSGGATLGDRIRMSEASLLPGVFIRSIAARSHVDGLAAAVPELIRLFSAAGYHYVIVETVGAGQNQFSVADYVHTLILVESPGAGDGVQMLKAGIMELADIYVVAKGDLPGAHRVSRELRAMLGLSGRTDDWAPPVVVTSSETGAGIASLLSEIDRHMAWMKETGKLDQKSQAMVRGAVRTILSAMIENRLASPEFESVARAVLDQEMTPDEAAEIILSLVARQRVRD